MKKYVILLVTLLTCLSLLGNVAEAKRFGGGGSFGKSRPMPAKQMQREQAAPQPAAPASGGANRWLGPLAGLAIGAGLATLFSHGGWGDFANHFSLLLMVVAGAMLLLFLINKLRKPQPVNSGYATANGAPTAFSNDASARTSTTAFSSMTPSVIPADFPVEAFLRQAKASFIRLQAANDARDLQDIRGYTTPEVFAEISLQIQERGQTAQSTEVVSIDATLLEVVDEESLTLASVRYQGVLRENGGPLEQIDEVWHLQKARDRAQAVWLLAGIQQAS